MARKTWAEKMQANGRTAEVSVIDRPFAGMAAGSKMLIATPEIVRRFVETIPSGETRAVADIRSELARGHNADFTCPLTTSIFLRIVSEAALDELAAGRPLQDITPFWRAVDPESPLARKLSCGPAFVEERRHAEACGR